MRTALFKFGLRWYNPTTGTFTQQDTLDTPLDPTNANRYAYAGDDPTNGNDPGGQYDSVGCGLSVLGFVAGATALGALAVVGAPETGGASLVAYYLGATSAGATTLAGIIGSAAYCG